MPSGEGVDDADEDVAEDYARCRNGGCGDCRGLWLGDRWGTAYADGFTTGHDHARIDDRDS